MQDEAEQLATVIAIFAALDDNPDEALRRLAATRGPSGRDMGAGADRRTLLAGLHTSRLSTAALPQYRVTPEMVAASRAWLTGNGYVVKERS